MAEHSTTFGGPDTPDALIADRERMWHTFTSATTAGVIITIIVLILMAVFLL
jgi:heme/copper-type cytochrome/quinol oxidase subunit 2